MLSKITARVYGHSNESLMSFFVCRILLCFAHKICLERFPNQSKVWFGSLQVKVRFLNRPKTIFVVFGGFILRCLDYARHDKGLEITARVYGHTNESLMSFFVCRILLLSHQTKSFCINKNFCANLWLDRKMRWFFILLSFRPNERSECVGKSKEE